MPVGKTMYTLLPKDDYGDTDFRKVQTMAKIFSVVVLMGSIIAMMFYLFRLLWCYDHSPINDVYYGTMASLISQVAIQGMNIAFGILFLMGAIKQQQSFLFLWLVSVFVLMSLETVVTIYSAALKDHANQVPPIVCAVGLYRLIAEAESCDDTEILL